MSKLTKIEKILDVFDSESRHIALAVGNDKEFPYVIGFDYVMHLVPRAVVLIGEGENKQSFPLGNIIQYKKLEMAKKDFEKLKTSLSMYSILWNRRKTKSAKIPKSSD